MSSLSPAVFLDRDGTLNIENEYVHRQDQWQWIPGAREAILSLNQAGYKVVVITNQAGIAHGYYTESDMHTLHAFVNADLATIGAHIDAYYHCPHHPKYDPCDCRKPSPYLLQIAMRDLHIDPTQSWMIGDKELDIQAAQNAGVKPILVLTGYGNDFASKVSCPITSDIAQACAMILRRGQ
jgi:D-glycero-D-manno-heptose 1,7-bisphosphate phosphatase